MLSFLIVPIKWITGKTGLQTKDSSHLKCSPHRATQQLIQFRAALAVLAVPFVQGPGTYLQGTGTVRQLGLFRRIQSHRAARAVRGGPTGGRCSHRQEGEKENVPLHRRRHHRNESRVWHLHNHGKRPLTLSEHILPYALSA